jgi:PAS domain-containing protein
MKVYTYSEARQRLASLLERARREGSVRIRRKDGRVFVLRPEAVSGSPLDVPGINLDLTREEIVDFVRAGRRKTR